MKTKKTFVDHINCKGWNVTATFDEDGHLLNWHDGAPTGRESAIGVPKRSRSIRAKHIIIDWAWRDGFSTIFKVSDKTGRNSVYFSISEIDEKISPQIPSGLRTILERSDSPDAADLLSAETFVRKTR